MTLWVGADSFAIEQIGPDYVFLTKPANLPPCCANIHMGVDNSTSAWAVRLPRGMSAAQKVVEIAKV